MTAERESEDVAWKTDIRRVAIVAAHPDDEAIGLGGCMHLLREPVIIHITDGAPRDLHDTAENGFATREQYAEERRRELLESLRAGGIAPADTVLLGYADQESALHMTQLAHELADVFARLRIDLLFTHPYEGGHPDHDAAAFAVHSACELLPERRRPRVVEFTSYHDRDGRMETGVFLQNGTSREVAMKLGPEARERKERMLACYRTQKKVLRNFNTREERFRPAPAYNFTSPPHQGRLFYEQFATTVTPQQWLELAQRATHDLGLL